MPSDSGDQLRRASPLTTKIHTPGVSPPEPEHLPCPRCDSTNTKFCYYNNYNFSQPRHFCKACRRYWTHGGTLRDIPVGGGTRKSAKRSRTTHTVAASTATSPLLGHTITATTTSADNLPLPATPVLLPLSANQLGTALRVGCSGDGKVYGGSGGVCGGGGGGGGATLCGSFTSLLNTQGPTGLLALGGFGVGVGTGLEDVGFGLGKGVWPFAGLGDSSVAGLGGNNVGVSSGGSGAVAVGGGGGMGSTWQLENGDNGFVVGGECFAWPDLAISTPGNGLK